MDKKTWACSSPKKIQKWTISTSTLWHLPSSDNFPPTTKRKIRQTLPHLLLFTAQSPFLLQLKCLFVLERERKGILCVVICKGLSCLHWPHFYWLTHYPRPVALREPHATRTLEGQACAPLLRWMGIQTRLSRPEHIGSWMGLQS